MFENVIDNYINRAKPSAIAAAQEARGWMRCVVNRLERIEAAIADDDPFTYVRHIVRVDNVGPIPITANADASLAIDFPVFQAQNSVPPNEEWTVESYAFHCIGTAGSLLVFRNGMFLFSATCNPTSQAPINGNNMRLMGGDILTCLASGGSPLTVAGWIQVRARRPNPSRIVKSAPAWENPPTSPNTGNNEVVEVPRHTGTFFLGKNVIGEARSYDPAN